MDVTLLAVGRLRPSFRAACDDYLRRLSRYTAVREVEVREASRAPTPEVQRRDEAALLLARVAGGTDLVCLARTGEAWSSAQLAEQVSRWQLRARPIAVLVGGSYGLDDELLERAQARWSLGPLTLPHELARVIALEQLYRAWTILRGEPYHKARRNR
ncbi:MAG TPA: 23S rRNA (pseudouridine(1915)-N(3))-methyltransferase RlmH [Gemmatimonadales bacterium]|jgi:23S rRNA (pseudouridine1915-N3)-methyltransferase|nr:23S rRNA (pseudouridine(1915)-N(3))-methyltransferase RlmH [Gemmatimonadales bacterium]